MFTFTLSIYNLINTRSIFHSKRALIAPIFTFKNLDAEILNKIRVKRFQNSLCNSFISLITFNVVGNTIVVHLKLFFFIYFRKYIHISHTKFSEYSTVLTKITTITLRQNNNYDSIFSSSILVTRQIFCT